MKKTLIPAVVAALTLGAALAASGPAAADMKQIPVVKLETTSEVAAPPQMVWTYMTTGKNLVTWCPEWKSAANMKINITKVGDVLDFTDAWGNNGRSIVTYLAPAKELRVVHEPNDGSYVCQSRMILTPTASGTSVHWIEQYTDESKPEDMKATAQKAEAEMADVIASIRKAVERK